MNRKIRSYVRRNGRMTPSQKNAFDKLWSMYGIAVSETPLNFTEIFDKTPDQKLVIEIGFGMGHSLITMAEQFPQYNFLGIEVHQPGIGSVLNAIHKKNLQNIRVIAQDATEVMQSVINQSLEAVLIFFPDPWPKKRHHKRRLIQSDFIALLIQKIKVGGYLHIATDWQPYAEYVDVILNPFPALKKTDALQDMLVRVKTKFEERGKKLGHSIHEMIYLIT